MTKAYSCVGEQQFNAYPIMGELAKSKDYVNQFGEFRASKHIMYNSLIEVNVKKASLERHFSLL